MPGSTPNHNENPEADTGEGEKPTNVDHPVADAEYRYFKSVCQGRLPPSGDACQDLRNIANQSQLCENLRQQWDGKWMPGRHVIEIAKEIRRARKYNELADECEAQNDC